MKSEQLPITDAAQASGAAQGGSVAASSGYWRSLGQLEGTPEFEQFLDREFPQAASEFPDGVSRRRWLKLMSASLALGSAAGCRYGPSEIASMVNRPANTIPGVAKKYATNFELAGRAVHLLVSNVDGRPIKVDGNPGHPLMVGSEPNDLSGGKKRFASAGTDVFSQGCILGLYDPDRTSQVKTRVEGKLEDSSWEAFAEYSAREVAALKASGGEKLAIVMSPSLSPSVNRLVAEAAAVFPKAFLVQHSAVDASAQAKACSDAAGAPAELLLKLDAAKVICALDSDLLGNDPNSVLYSRQFAKGRTPEPGKMNRLYSVEARYSVTGAAADSRMAVKSSQLGALIAKLEKRVDEFLGGAQVPASAEGEKEYDKIKVEEQLERFVDAMAEDLVAHQGSSVVSVGSHQPLEVQVAALRLNKKLGNFGKTVMLMPGRSALGGEVGSLAGLSQKLESGAVDHVWILGDNPVYSAPGASALGEQLAKLDHVVYVGEFVDETAEKSSWVLPQAHQLESWGDVLGVDGSYGVGQPQILPLLNGRSVIEVLSMVLGQALPGEEIVKATAAVVAGAAVSSRSWRETLHDGFMKGVSASPLPVGEIENLALTGEVTPGGFESNELEVVFAPSDTLYDGRFAKNVWMQELPQAMTKIVWDNAAIVGPKTAERLGLKQGQRSMTETVKLMVDEKRHVELPVFIMPGQAAGSITVHLGYGRVCRDEAVDSNVQVSIGSNVSALRDPSNGHVLVGVKALATSKPYKLATTQDHFAIEDHGLEITKERAAILSREGTVDKVDGQYVKDLGTHHPELTSLWEEPIEALNDDPTVPYNWAMTIDLNKCTGCNSCVVACQAENNIPVVGKEQVSRGREMHWIRVDRYFRGDVETPKIVNQPVACAHCETAPCEQVCPVAATVHTEEGINAMAYNRCIGTRYCANNCPYKVRRFNYFNYNTEYGYFYGWEQRGKLEEANRRLQQLVLNPDVSVRGRGVMEKCTYCIQRVQNGKIHARAEGRPVEDGEIKSACQEACPTQAIVFGDKKDKTSKVSQLRNDPRNYEMLGELNIKPRTTYLARIRNTHPRLRTHDQLEDIGHGHGGHGEGHDEAHGEGDTHAAEGKQEGEKSAAH